MVSLLKKSKKESATKAGLIYNDGYSVGASNNAKTSATAALSKNGSKLFSSLRKSHHGSATPPPTPDDGLSPDMRVDIVPRSRTPVGRGGEQYQQQQQQQANYHASPDATTGHFASPDADDVGPDRPESRQSQAAGSGSSSSSVVSSLMTRFPMIGCGDNLNSIQEENADEQLRRIQQGRNLSGQRYAQAPVWGLAPSEDDDDTTAFGGGGQGGVGDGVNTGNDTGNNKANESYDDIELVLKESPARSALGRPPSPVKTPSGKKSSRGGGGGGGVVGEPRNLGNVLDAEADQAAVVSATRQELLRKSEEARARERAADQKRNGGSSALFSSAPGVSRQQKRTSSEASSTALAGGGGGGGDSDFVDASVASALETWRSATDPATGRTYYYNRVTKETKWDPPPELVDAYKTVVAKKAAMAAADTSAASAGPSGSSDAAISSTAGASSTGMARVGSTEGSAANESSTASTAPSTELQAQSRQDREHPQMAPALSGSPNGSEDGPANQKTSGGSFMKMIPGIVKKKKKKGRTSKKDAKAIDQEAGDEEEEEIEDKGQEEDTGGASEAGRPASTPTIPLSQPIPLPEAGPRSRRSEPRAAAVELVPGADGEVISSIERVTSADTVDNQGRGSTVPAVVRVETADAVDEDEGADTHKNGAVAGALAASLILKKPFRAVRSMSHRAGAAKSAASSRMTRSLDEADRQQSPENDGEALASTGGVVVAAAGSSADGEGGEFETGVHPMHPTTTKSSRGKFGFSMNRFRSKDSRDAAVAAASEDASEKSPARKGGKIGTSYWTPPRSSSSSKKKTMGWRSVVDSTSGKTYYYHSATKETRWDKPEDFDEQQDRLAAEERSKKKSSKKGVAAFIGWKSVLDKGSGKTYYYHTATKEVTWAKPDDFDEQTNKAKSVTASPQRQVKLSYGNTSARTGQSGTNPESPPRSRAGTAPDSPPRTTNVAVMCGEVRDFEPVSLGDNLEMAKALARALPEEEENHDRLLAQYKGREDDLLLALDELQEETPFDERIEYDAIVAKMDQIENRPEAKAAAPQANGQAPSKARGGAVGLNNRVYSSLTAGTGTVMTGLSSMSGIKSKASEKTERIANTTKATGGGGVPTIAEEENAGDTSLSSLNDTPERPKQRAIIGAGGQADPRDNGLKNDLPRQVPTPSSVLQPVLHSPVVEKASMRSAPSGESGLSSKMSRSVGLNDYDDNYAGDNDDNDDGDESVADSISALSTSDVEFAGMRSRQVRRKKKVLGEAMEKRDWERAAAAANELQANNSTVSPGGRAFDSGRPRPKVNVYQRAKRDGSKEWSQTELDKFISQNDWNSVAQYIAIMRSNSADQRASSSNIRDAGSSDRYDSHMSKSHDCSQTSGSRREERAPVLPRKQVGARSQLQHEYLSDSSWDSESESDDDSQASDWESLTSGPSYDYGSKRRDGRRNFPPKDVGMKQMHV